MMKIMEIQKQPVSTQRLLNLTKNRAAAHFCMNKELFHVQGKNKLLMVADSFEMKAPPSLSHEKSVKKMKK